MKVISIKATLSKLSKPSQREASSAQKRRSSKLKKTKPRPKGPRMRLSVCVGFFLSYERKKKSKPRFPTPRPPPFFYPLELFSPPPSASLPLLFPPPSPPQPLYPRGEKRRAIWRKKGREGRKCSRRNEEEKKTRGKKKNVGSAAEIVFSIFPSCPLSFGERESTRDDKRAERGERA